jgi:hypothetical protein
MGSAVDRLKVALADEVAPVQHDSPFVPPNWNPELGKSRGEYIARYMFKHRKKGDHGRKAWSVEVLQKSELQQGRGGPSRLVTSAYAGKSPDGGTYRWTSVGNVLNAANGCPDCGLPSVNGGYAVKGTYDADITCGSRCIAATGHDCECQCGGQNHGIGWG